MNLRAVPMRKIVHDNMDSLKEIPKCFSASSVTK